MTRRIHVSIPVFAECDPSIVYGAFDTLWAAGRPWDDFPGLAPEGLFQPRLVAAEPGPMTLITGVSIIPQDVADEVTATDIVFVPNVLIMPPGSPDQLDRRLVDWIVRMHSQGALICGTCGGVLVLAETGLLDGQEATTHWSYAPLFRRLYPNVTLRMERILVQTGPAQSIVCSGGASSWQDLALFLIAKFAGAEEAIRISKLFLYQWHRNGQLAYASMVRNVNHGDAVIQRCQEWLADNYHRGDAVMRAAARSGLPKRSFDRRFRAATGYSPLAYVQTLRVEESKQLLETSGAAVEAIAREVGYVDGASFGRLFRRQTGLSPGDYRRSFRLPDFVGRMR